MTTEFLQYLREKLGHEPNWFEYMAELNKELAVVRERYGELKFGKPDLETEIRIALAGFSSTGKSVAKGRYGFVEVYTDKSGSPWGIKRQLKDKDTEARRAKRGITEEQMLESEVIPLEAAQHNVAPRLVGEGFIAMSLFDKDLEQILEDGKPLDEFRFVRLSKNILNGLGYTHRDLKRVHSDIKPDNILLDKNGIAYIADFGNSSSSDEEDSVSRSCFGFRYTLAPERFEHGNKGDERSDVWALGALLGRLTTGEYPFEKLIGDSEDARTVINKSTQAELSMALEGYFAKVPRWLNNFFRKALSYYPDGRFKDAREMESEFYKSLENYEINKPIPRLKRWLPGITAVLLGIGSAIGFGIYDHYTKKLEDKVEKQEHRIKYNKKAKNIQEILRSMKRQDPSLYEKGVYTDTNIEDLVEQSKFRAWLERFAPYDSEKKQYKGDVRTAVAAYLNPGLIFRLVKQTGSTDYKKLEPIIIKEDIDLYGEIANNIYNISDSWFGSIGYENYGKERDIWPQLERDYERLQELESWESASFRKFKDEITGPGMWEAKQIMSTDSYHFKSYVSKQGETDKYEELRKLRQTFQTQKSQGEKK